MPKTTGAITGIDATIYVSTDDVTYTDISGTANSWSIKGGDRKAGDLHVLGADTPIVKTGKLQMVDVTLKVVYSEIAAEGADLINGYVSANTPVYLRLRPKGDGVGNWQFKGGPGYFLTPSIPSVDAGNEKPVLIETHWVGPDMTQSAQT